MYDADDRYWKRQRRFDACQTAWDFLAPPDDDAPEPEREPEDDEPDGDEAADFGGMDI